MRLLKFNKYTLLYISFSIGILNEISSMQIKIISQLSEKILTASCEDWTHDPWFTRPVLYHWAKQAILPHNNIIL